jgi:hypothetical protein
MILLAIATLIPCWYAYRKSIGGGQVEINHVTCFSLGFLYYWITPLAVRVLAAHMVFPLHQTWLAFFRERWIDPYALSCIGLYLCFLLGDHFGARWCKPPKEGGTIPTLALSLSAIFGFVLLLYSVYSSRAYFFLPSVPGAIKIHSALGEVTACVVLLSCVALMFTLQRPGMPWHKLLLSRYFLPALVGAGLLVFRGSRLYVASLLVMFAIYQTNYRAKFKLKWMVAAVLVFALFFGFVGTSRQGLSSSGVLRNILMEPLFISLSLAHHLRQKGIEWINAPTELLSDLENLVPTVLMPNKYEVLKQPDAWRPLGGLHSFVAFNLYFGLIGTAVFWFLLPVGMRYLRARRCNTLFATMYIMCSGWLTFSIFRNPFSLSLVKNILEQSILIPWLIACLGWFLLAACAPGNPNQNSSGPSSRADNIGGGTSLSVSPT